MPIQSSSFQYPQPTYTEYPLINIDQDLTNGYVPEKTPDNFSSDDSTEINSLESDRLYSILIGIRPIDGPIPGRSNTPTPSLLERFTNSVCCCLSKRN